MTNYVKPKNVSVTPSIRGFFRSFLTLGIADWTDSATVTCGECSTVYIQYIPSGSSRSVCPCCDAINGW